MKKFTAVAKRYKFFLLLLVLNLIFLIVLPETKQVYFSVTKDNLLEMISVLPPIFVLLGLMDVWVERETMIKYMGQQAGLRGGVLAFFMGAAAAGPLYAAFPVAGLLMKKGAGLFNVFIFIGAWSATKIPMLLFETANLGWRYMLLRLGFNIAGIILIAWLMVRSTPESDKQAMIERAKNL